MGISFLPNLLVYAVFVDWRYLYNYDLVRKGLYKLNEANRTESLSKMAVTAFVLWSIYIWLGNLFTLQVGVYKILGGNMINSLLMIGAVGISLFYILTLAYKKLKKTEEYREEEVVRSLANR